MDEWAIERLRPSHDRADFSCGKPPLDTFLRSLASQYEKRRLGRTVVATEPDRGRVAGYYTLAAGSFDESCPPAEIRVPRDAYSYFRPFQPTARADYSIFLYHLAPAEGNPVRGDDGLLVLPARGP